VAPLIAGIIIIIIIIIEVLFHVLTVENIKMRAFWDIAPCGLEESHRRFRCAYCLHHQADDDGGSTHF
jgi:hypothetical protein